MKEMLSKVKDLESSAAKQMASWPKSGQLRPERVEQRSLDLIQKLVSLSGSKPYTDEEQNPGQDEYAKAALRYPNFDETADILCVRAKYPEATAETWLVDRLGRAITRRRQFMLYRKDHQKRLEEAHILKPDLDKETMGSKPKASTPPQLSEERGPSTFEDGHNVPEDKYHGRPMTQYVDITQDTNEGLVRRTPRLPLTANGLKVKYNEFF